MTDIQIIKQMIFNSISIPSESLPVEIRMMISEIAKLYESNPTSARELETSLVRFCNTYLD